MIKGSPWERLNVGIFKQPQQAVSLLNKIQKTYPRAWIQKTSEKSTTVRFPRPAASAQPARTATIKTEKPTLLTVSATKQVTLPGGSSLSEKQLDSLMQRAKTDFKNKKYSSSIRFLNALVAAGEHQHSHDALELLGLARQRKGQKAHAVDTYEKYLALYPDAEGADRVQQRLIGLLTASNVPKENIRMSTKEGRANVTTYGSLAQYYQHNQTAADNANAITTQSQLITFIDLTTLHRTAGFDQRYQLTGDHLYDFIDNRDRSEFRFIDAYYELSHRKTGHSTRLGRQPLRTGGILKRFDGLSAGYQLTPDIRLNLIGGFPVGIDNKSSLNQHKTFYGITFESGTFLEHWSMNLFYFDQQANGLQDLKTAGADVRYRDKNKSLFAMLDYDLFYDEVTVLQLNTNVQLNPHRSLYLNAFMRKSPQLATTNALIGRQEQNLEQLKKVLNIEQIIQLARDRTTHSEMLTIGGAQQISPNLQLTADLSLARLGDTIASAGVAATPDTGTAYFLNTQLIVNSLLMKHDSNVFGVRYYDTDALNTTSFIVNARFPVSRHWRLNPRLQYDFHQFNNGRSQQKLRLLFKADYRFSNKMLFDFYIAYDKTFKASNGQDMSNNHLFFLMGYRWDF